jgi:hypothetical protein
MSSTPWYSTEKIYEMIAFLRKAANSDGGLDYGDYWCLCDEAADMLESMLHYETEHGLREDIAGACDE